MGIRWLSCLLLLSAVAFAADVPTTTSVRDPAATRGVLLKIEYSPTAPSADSTGTTAPAEAAPPLSGVTYVRVGDDGFARFPLTERNLPFAELEPPVIAAMLAAHLKLHGHPAMQLTISRQEQADGLVTVFGKVAHPGVYSLPATATIEDAIIAAGGVLSEPGANGAPVQPTLTHPLPQYRNTTESGEKGVSSQPTLSNAASIPASLNLVSPGAGESTARSTKPRHVSVQGLKVRLEHPQFNLGALSNGNAALVVDQSRFASTRLCIDGIILHVELPPPASSNDLFKPL